MSNLVYRQFDNCADNSTKSDRQLVIFISILTSHTTGYSDSLP
ncbi:MAG: hypothetical protein PUP92_18335 [Rhizonema sp. PD38]|nr:hypothetical protein [Rhizonema sp. PD38]